MSAATAVLFAVAFATLALAVVLYASSAVHAAMRGRWRAAVRAGAVGLCFLVLLAGAIALWY